MAAICLTVVNSKRLKHGLKFIPCKKVPFSRLIHILGSWNCFVATKMQFFLLALVFLVTIHLLYFIFCCSSLHGAACGYTLSRTSWCLCQVFRSYCFDLSGRGIEINKRTVLCTVCLLHIYEDNACRIHSHRSHVQFALNK